MQLTQRYQVNEPTVIQEIIEGEAIIADLGQGFYYSLDATGSMAWNALVSGCTVGSIIDAFAVQFPAEREEIATGISQLVERLTEEMLIVPASGEGVEPVQLSGLAESCGKAFTAPVLSKYTDMEQLLLLDPIHDVDETGWPNLPGEKTQD